MDRVQRERDAANEQRKKVDQQEREVMAEIEARFAEESGALQKKVQDEAFAANQQLAERDHVEAEARDALSTAAEKTEKWDEEDKAWEEKGWGSAADDGSC